MGAKVQILQLYLRLRPSSTLVEGLRGLGQMANARRLQLRLRFRPLPILVEGLEGPRDLGVMSTWNLPTASSSFLVSSNTGTMGPVLRRAIVLCIGLAST